MRARFDRGLNIAAAIAAAALARRDSGVLRQGASFLVRTAPVLVKVLVFLGVVALFFQSPAACASPLGKARTFDCCASQCRTTVEHAAQQCCGVAPLTENTGVRLPAGCSALIPALVPATAPIQHPVQDRLPILTKPPSVIHRSLIFCSLQL